MNQSTLQNTKSPLLNDVLNLMKYIKDIHHTTSLLGWDQETYMPLGALIPRANQMVTLESIAHKLLTSKKARLLADKIENYLGTSDAIEQGIFRTFLKEHKLATKLPKKFIENLTKVKTYSTESWKKARQDNNYKLFEKDFEILTQLKIEQANYYGFSENPYDPMLDLYEPGITSNFLLPYFQSIKKQTINLLDYALEISQSIDDSFLFDYYDKHIQFSIAKQICEKMGFDFYYGRLDKSIHPFTTSFSQKDVRISIRVLENDIRCCIFSVIHEAGHGLYEQGIRTDFYRTFLEEGASYGIHESQSLLWEKIIARTYEFSQWLLPILKDNFPMQFKNVSPTDFFRAINKIKKTFLRTEADELTYNLHIILRFEIENELLNSRIKARDIPEIWNTKYFEMFGMIPLNLKEGCLQDIHWAHGSFGYFPTYTLGKIYSAMLWNKLEEDMPNILNDIQTGNFSLIKNWLRENIHQYGKLYEPKDIMQKVTDKVFDVSSYNNYIKNKIEMLKK